eukprot:8144270-Ditylum_brightwellii.AAC.1
MICTTAAGSKVPIAVIGKSAKPKCFDGNDVPLPYMNQRNAWSDQDITKWWIHHVLLPYHNRKHGHGMSCCILLDNCSAHKFSDQEFEDLEARN